MNRCPCPSAMEVAKMLRERQDLPEIAEKNRRIHRYHQPGKPFAEFMEVTDTTWCVCQAHRGTQADKGDNES